jgi:outer membrane protein assembly factor BamB
VRDVPLEITGMMRTPIIPSCRFLHPALLAAAALFSVSGSVFAQAQRVPEPEVIASTETGWPQFRGPRRDGVSEEKGLLQSWPEGGPKLLWKTENVGKGFSSPIVVGDRLYITGDVGEELHVFAFDLQGKKIWQTKNGAFWKDPYPGARGTLTYSDGHLYHQNAHGRVACLEAKTGREVWAVNVLERFGGQNITWGISECLLVDERAVYVTAGGSEALLVALDKKTGEVIWKSAPLNDAGPEKAVENPSYVSPILVRYGDRRLVVGCSTRNLYVADAANGAIQWTRRFPTRYLVISMMPALIGDGIFMTAPHGTGPTGGRFFRLTGPASPGAPVGVEDGWTTKLDTLQGCAVQTKGKLIGSFYGGRKGWAALNPQNGEVLYENTEFVKGAPLVADNRIYALCEDGTMVLFEAGADRFDVRGSFRLAEASRRDAWAHPVVLNGRMYLRYHDTLYCYDVKG